MEETEQRQSTPLNNTTSARPRKACVLVTAILGTAEVIKKPMMAASMDEVEKELKRACASLSDLSVERVLVYNKFFDDYVDEPNHALLDRDKIMVHFSVTTMPSTFSTTVTSTRPQSAKPSTSALDETSESTLVFAKDSNLKISLASSEIQESSESHIGQLSEKDIEERSKIFGRDGKPVNRYGKKINAMAFALAKEDPLLTLNRGNLLQAARKALHESGYEYARGKKSRSKKFGAYSAKSNKEKEVSKYTPETVRQERLNELTQMITSLQGQMEYLEKAKESLHESLCAAESLYNSILFQ